MKFLRFQLSLGICTYYFNMENIINAKLDLICLNFFKFLCQHIIFFFFCWPNGNGTFGSIQRFALLLSSVSPIPLESPPPLSIIRTPLDYFFNQMWEVLWTEPGKEATSHSPRGLWMFPLPFRVGYSPLISQKNFGVDPVLCGGLCTRGNQRVTFGQKFRQINDGAKPGKH